MTSHMDHDDIARKRAERARRKLDQSQNVSASTPDTARCEKPAVADREWMHINHDVPVEQDARRVRLVSWNMLAQSLVRRELFPGSDCLKLKTRLPGIVAEMTSHDNDLGCFQEVDSINEIAPSIRQAGFDFVYERGYEEKKHGLMIMWKTKASTRATFESPVWKKVVRLDDVDKWGDTVDGPSLSRCTRNILLIVALPFSSGPGGIIVATTHLFWHPRYGYERARQAAVIMRELSSLRAASQEDWSSWPIVLAGDLNDQPHSSTYTLLTGQAAQYRDQIRTDLIASRVVHTSVDESRGLRTVHYAATVTEAGDEDRVLGRHRAPKENELLLPDEIIGFAQFDAGPTRPGHFRSAYGSHYAQLGPHAEFFRDRGTAPERYDQTESPIPTDQRQLQSFEPKWTLFSPLFRLTLDYILLAPRAHVQGPDFPVVTALLSLSPESVLHPGVPRVSVCSSDHIMIGAELAL